MELEGEAQPVAVIVYDELLMNDQQLIDAVASASALAIEKHQLDAELRANLEELRASRERIVEAAYDERRRIERNLHDGAQQRLVSLALELRMARSSLDSDPRCRSTACPLIGYLRGSSRLRTASEAPTRRAARAYAVSQTASPPSLATTRFLDTSFHRIRGGSCGSSSTPATGPLAAGPSRRRL